MPRLDPGTPAAALLARELGGLACDALLVLADSSRDPDLAPFAGGAHLNRSFLLAPRGGAPRLGYFFPMEHREAAASGLEPLGPEELGLYRLARRHPRSSHFLAAAVERAFEAAGLPPGRVALAGHAPAGEVHETCGWLEERGFDFVSGGDVVRRLRRAKGEAEAVEVRRAGAGAAAALRRVAACLAGAVPREGELWLEGERLTVARLRSEIALVLARHRLEQPKGNLVAPAEEGAAPHSTGSSPRVLAPAESLVVDLYPHGRLFADCTRTFCVGEPPEALAAAHREVRAALAEVTRRVRPGVRGEDLEDGVCTRLEEAGYPTLRTHPQTGVGYVHHLGHGVGWELHELPSFARGAGDEGVLAVGDVFTLEPGLYHPEEGWAVRLEDLVYLGPAGPENLTPLPYDLDPRAWGPGS